MNRVILVVLLLSALVCAQERAPVKCTEDSPERRGEEGCTVLTSRPLLVPVNGPVYWHLDRFDSLEAAKMAAAPNSVAAEAHGSIWLMTVEGKSKTHHNGRHVAWVGPIVLTSSGRNMMRVQSSLLRPGGSTPVHIHPASEVVYVIDGEQCMETPGAGYRLGAGKTLILPGGTIHRGRVSGNKARRALGLVLFEGDHPSSRDLSDPPRLVPCK